MASMPALNLIMNCICVSKDVRYAEEDYSCFVS